MNRNLIKGVVCIVVIGVCIVGWSFLVEAIAQTQYGENNQGFIRFHVLANSDSPQDQKLKLMVRDSLIKYLEPMIKDVNEKEKVKAIILNNKANLIKIASETLLRQGVYYPVDIEYGIFDFPLKAYGEVIVPQGKYEAVRVLIGNAEGSNWWCVLFPPLCFVDESKVVHISEDEKIKEDIEHVENNLEFRYKIAEIIKSL